MPDAAIASDIIVGFPGETDEQFEHTYRVLEASPISYLHVFGYSRRSGTPAATYRQVDGRVIKVRTARLIELSKEKSRVYRERFVGKSLRVLVESSGLEGTSENFIRVGLDVPENLCLLPNQWKTARVTRVDERGTWAEMLEP
jgi:threonylcarbamoyladenosine tRNA methylthiotransferase MtaB